MNKEIDKQGFFLSSNAVIVSKSTVSLKHCRPERSRSPFCDLPIKARRGESPVKKQFRKLEVGLVLGLR
jgi:hypothetical protein